VSMERLFPSSSFLFLILYVVKKFTAYFIVHFTNWLTDFGPSVLLAFFSPFKKHSTFGGRGVGGNESEREVFVQRASSSALAFRKRYVLIKKQCLCHHTAVFLIADKFSLYCFVGF
jgi:hypothetical protein